MDSPNQDGPTNVGADDGTRGRLSHQQATSTPRVTLVKRRPARVNPLSGCPRLGLRATRPASTQKATSTRGVETRTPAVTDTRGSESTGAPMGFGPESEE
jgi:hypothetical protein